jgi:hypothetical protein
MGYEDAPATTGRIRIANIKGLGGYALHRWPIDEVEVELHVRVMDNGDWYLSIDEDLDIED